MASPGLFQGETALVTGAASNIGRAIAKALAREGAAVLATDIDAARGTSLIGEIEAAGGKAAFLQADLSKRDAADTLLAQLGKPAMNTAVENPISIFVHSASPRRDASQTVASVTADAWDAMVDTHVRTGFFLARALAGRMAEAKLRGRLLFITSLHAETPRNIPHYAVSKAGQTMIVKELARFYGPAGIRVNALAPGAIGGGGFTPPDLPALEAKIALRRMGTADDIANAAVALLSDRYSAYVTGTTLVVDGGIALHNWIDPATIS